LLLAFVIVGIVVIVVLYSSLRVVARKLCLLCGQSEKYETKGFTSIIDHCHPSRLLKVKAG
jgi:hypothetical protein